MIAFLSFSLISAAFLALPPPSFHFSEAHGSPEIDSESGNRQIVTSLNRESLQSKCKSLNSQEEKRCGTEDFLLRHVQFPELLTFSTDFSTSCY
jgi:hypothetical protein